VGATVLPEDADNKVLEWTSDNEHIASVDQNGVVSPKGYGTATITAKATDGSYVESDLKVDIAIPVSGIMLTTKERGRTLYIEGAKRDSVALEAVILPSEASHQEVLWKASDDSVALLPSGDNGEKCLITARKNSENTTITATDYRGLKFATFDIKVRTKISAMQIALEPKAGYADGAPMNIVNSKANTFKLNAKVFPTDASTEEIIWISSNSNIKVDGQGNITTTRNMATGTYTITAKTSDGRITAVKQIKVNQGVIAILLTYDGPPLASGAEYVLADMESRYYNIEIYPIHAYNKELSATSDNTDAIKVQYEKDKNRIKVMAQFLGQQYPDEDDDVSDGEQIPTNIRVLAKDGSNASAVLSLLIGDPLC
jgi:uncharacterized protein YjdB